MLLAISSLHLSENVALQLRDDGFFYVEDIQVELETATCYNALQEVQTVCKVPVTLSALDILQDELQRHRISTLSQELDNILCGGFQCKTITELSGAPSSGKTQICLQICISVQIRKLHNGLIGEALYIDTRSGLSTMRLKELAMSCRSYFEGQDFDMNKVLDQIIVARPQTYDDLVTVLDNFEHLTKNRQIRVIVVDSLSFLRHSIENNLQRTQIRFKILDRLQKIATKYNVAVVITNELSTQIMTKSKIELAPAIGTLCAHRVHTRLLLTRLDHNQFAARAIKASTMPKVSSKFQVTTAGIRDIMD